MSQLTDSKAVLRRYVAAVSAGDENLIRELFSDDATWTLAAGAVDQSVPTVEAA
jgi:hypothetical protein